MKDSKVSDFSPELRIFGFGDNIVVIFDSLFKLDTKRAMRSILLPKNFQQLSFAIEGFDEKSVKDISTNRTIIGKIYLIIMYANGEKDKYELADCKFMLPAIGKLKNGEYKFTSVEQVAYSVRHAVSNALLAALTHFYAMCSKNNDHYAINDQSEIISNIPDKKGSHKVVNKKGGKVFQHQMIFSIFGIPLLIWFVLWAGAKAFSPTPVEVAVGHGMLQDPESVALQVELTRQTLQQMGLDPGQGSDMGCLVSQ